MAFHCSAHERAFTVQGSQEAISSPLQQERAVMSPDKV